MLINMLMLTLFSMIICIILLIFKACGNIVEYVDIIVEYVDNIVEHVDDIADVVLIKCSVDTKCTLCQTISDTKNSR